MTLAAIKAVFPLRDDLVPRVARWFHALSDETRLERSAFVISPTCFIPRSRVSRFISKYLKMLAS
jgi:hypothetical protein